MTELLLAILCIQTEFPGDDVNDSEYLGMCLRRKMGIVGAGSSFERTPTCHCQGVIQDRALCTQTIGS